MATTKSSPAAEITDIQRRMAQIRRELHEEVREAVKGAQSLTDWRSQVKNHPWIALGTAAAVGYLIVPKRKPLEVPTHVTLTPPASSYAAMAPVAAPAPKKSRLGILGSAFGLLAPIAVRAAQNYAMQYLEQYLAGQQFGPGPSGPEPGAAPRPGPASRPRPAEGGIGSTRPASPFGNAGRAGDIR